MAGWLRSSSCHWLRSRWSVPGVSSSQEARLISPPSESCDSWTEEKIISNKIGFTLKIRYNSREKLRIQRIKQREVLGSSPPYKWDHSPSAWVYTDPKLSHLRVGRPCSSVFLKYDLFLSSSESPVDISILYTLLLWGHSATGRLGLHGNHV